MHLRIIAVLLFLMSFFCAALAGNQQLEGPGLCSKQSYDCNGQNLDDLSTQRIQDRFDEADFKSNPADLYTPTYYFFVTDRKLDERARTGDIIHYPSGFESEFGNGTAYGWMKATIPTKRLAGEKDYNADRSRANPTLDIALGTGRLKATLDDLISTLGKNPETGDQPSNDNTNDQISHSPVNILIFIHGINNDFQDAGFRAVQIAEDIKFNGEVIVFSWPTPKSDDWFGTVQSFFESMKNSDRATKDFRPILAALTERSAARIHLLAHSMGSRVAVGALLGPSNLRIATLTLSAAEIPQANFSFALARISSRANLITDYCSQQDSALRTAQLWDGDPRLGLCAGSRPLPGVDDIFVNDQRPIPEEERQRDYWHHVFYTDSAKVLEDYESIVKTGVSAQVRLGNLGFTLTLNK